MAQTFSHTSSAAVSRWTPDTDVPEDIATLPSRCIKPTS
jgi:hypothetical protein